jgi:hypothetical protein
VSRGVSVRRGGLSSLFRSLRAGWLAHLILLRAVARGVARKVHKVRKASQVGDEEQIPGLHQHMRLGEQVHHAQGGPAVVDEGRRRGPLVGVVAAFRMVLLMGRTKPEKKIGRMGCSRLLHKGIKPTQWHRLSGRNRRNSPRFPNHQTGLLLRPSPTPHPLNLNPPTLSPSPLQIPYFLKIQII